MPSFVHLHVHTEYAIRDSILRLSPCLAAVASYGMSALALTDPMNLFAAVKFYKQAHALGIKPIFGCELRVREEDPFKEYVLVVLCQNNRGYQNLTQLISKAYVSGQSKHGVWVTYDWVCEHQEGLIILSGGVRGALGQAILAKDLTQARALLQAWKDLLGDRFCIELQSTGRASEETYNDKVLDLAHEFRVPVVATNDVRFLHRDDFEAHEARVCIYESRILGDPTRPHQYSEEQYLRTPEEMHALFQAYPEALENTLEIAKRCNVYLDLGHNYLPEFPTPSEWTLAQYFTHAAEQGLRTRLNVLFPCESERIEARPIYDNRLATELEVIQNMGFEGYFLIVADFIQWARTQGIPVGPGRGSGVGSLVAYALQITDLDPLKYDLLFERFLNPERVSMPDFDIDFCMEGRDRVIEYVMTKYGNESVAQIITYGSMAARAVVRDVGRVLGHPYGFPDKIAKLIPFEIGMTLEKALKQEDLKTLYQKEEEVSELIDLARKLEGLPRNIGKHASGIVIAPSKLTDFSPIYAESAGAALVTQFDKDDIESVGLVKFDFLGLTTLTIIDWAVKSIGSHDWDITRIPLDDPKTFALLNACQTTAVFQLESRGMKDLIQRVKPDCFEEIIALVALYRPGPLQSGMTDDFVARKHKLAQVEYTHPLLAPILKSTYGVILYQEQVMQIAQVLAGYTLGAADLLRKAMGKKKPAEMAKQRTVFITGSAKQGIDASTATSIFDLMEKFAGYGFNKSHSAAYALLSYQTAWLKAHYPAHFMASALSVVLDHTDKVEILIEECKHLKLQVIPPDLHQSLYFFSVNETGAIVYGLGAIKGVGRAAAELIMEERACEPFCSLFDFCKRIEPKKVTRRVTEALILAGTFDALGVDRRNLMANLVSAFKLAEQNFTHTQNGQRDLLSLLEIENTSEPYEMVLPWTEQERLQAEKKALGFYLTGHPYTQYQKECAHFVTYTLSCLVPALKIIVAGWVVSVRRLITKKGSKMAVVTLDDGTARIEIAVFPEQYTLCHAYLNPDEILVIEGSVKKDKLTENLRMAAQKVTSLVAAREIHAKGILCTLMGETFTKSTIATFADTLKTHPRGRSPLFIAYKNGGSQTVIRLDPSWNILPNDDLLEKIKALPEVESVAVWYR